MAKTLAQIADESARQLGAEYSDLDVKETFDQYIVEALHEILLAAPWGHSIAENTITATASQTAYSLALGTGDIQSIYRNDGQFVRELQRTTKARLIEDGKDMTITGEPEYWYEHGMSGDQKVIGLYPTPTSNTATYGVRATLDPSQLTPTSTWPLPEDFIVAARHLIRKLHKDSSGDYHGADRAGMSFGGVMRKLSGRYNNPSAGKVRFKASDLPSRQVINHLKFPDTIT